MVLALLLALQAQTIVEIRDLSPQEHRVVSFVLDASQALRLTAVGAEPAPERLRRDRDAWQDDEQSTWPAAAWILDARTRAVVWDMRAVETERSANGLRRFSGTVQLPAGVYEAHYASYPAAVVSIRGELDLRTLARLGRRMRYGGPYVDDGLYKEFVLTIDGSGRVATSDEIDAARDKFTASAIAAVVPERSATARQGFELTRPTAIEVYAIGEVRRDGGSDYGWIINAATRERVWKMEYDNSEPAGGAHKNRMIHETVRLKAGRYAAYFTSDDSHGPDEWNTVPATDPAFWGLTLRVADAAARASVRPFNYEPVPAGQTIVSLTRIGDGATRSAGFTLRRAMEVRIYALGEGTDEMVDYAWIVDATNHGRVWTMRLEDTEPAGGAEKNRLFDGTVRLEPGSYMVHYTSDGSHSYNNWNSSPPAEERYWGVSVFPASGRLNPADVGPFQRPSGGAVIVQLVRVDSDASARATFRLPRETRLRIYALGEGSRGEMFDFGWIEDADGRRMLWEMKYDETEPAGGASKNRVFDGTITLPAGEYVLRYRTDGSHAYGDWNDDPPDDPESWGITVFRIGDR